MSTEVPAAMAAWAAQMQAVARFEPDMPDAIVSALFLAQADVADPEADGTGATGYRYVRADSIVRTARAAMHPHGLFVTLGGVRFEDAGPLGVAVVRDVVLRLVADEQQDRPACSHVFRDAIRFPVEMGKRMTNDKATAAAMTSSLAYFLRDLLQISRLMAGDEIEQRHDGEASGVDLRDDTTQRPSVLSRKNPADRHNNGKRPVYMPVERRQRTDAEKAEDLEHMRAEAPWSLGETTGQEARTAAEPAAQPVHAEGALAAGETKHGTGVHEAHPRRAEDDAGAEGRGREGRGGASPVDRRDGPGGGLHAGEGGGQPGPGRDLTPAEREDRAADALLVLALRPDLRDRVEADTALASTNPGPASTITSRVEAALAEHCDDPWLNEPLTPGEQAAMDACDDPANLVPVHVAALLVGARMEHVPSKRVGIVEAINEEHPRQVLMTWSEPVDGETHGDVVNADELRAVDELSEAMAEDLADSSSRVGLAPEERTELLAAVAKIEDSKPKKSDHRARPRHQWKGKDVCGRCGESRGAASGECQGKPAQKSDSDERVLIHVENGRQLLPVPDAAGGGDW